MPAAILVPGLGAGPWIYDGLKAELDGCAQFVDFAIPGMAGEPPGDGPLIEGARESLRELVEEGREPTFLVAHSLGAAIALSLAGETPSGLAGLVVLDAGPRPVPPEELPALEREIRKTADQLFPAADRAASEERLSDWIRAMVGDARHGDRLARDFLRSDPHRLREFFIDGRMLQHRIEPTRIVLPLLVLVACESERQKREYEADFSARYAGAADVRIASLVPAKHFLMLDQGRSAADLIRSFIGKLAVGSHSAPMGFGPSAGSGGAADGP